MGFWFLKRESCPAKVTGNWSAWQSIGPKGDYNIVVDLTRRHPFQIEIGNNWMRRQFLMWLDVQVQRLVRQKSTGGVLDFAPSGWKSQIDLVQASVRICWDLDPRSNRPGEMLKSKWNTRYVQPLIAHFTRDNRALCFKSICPWKMYKDDTAIAGHKWPGIGTRSIDIFSVIREKGGCQNPQHLIIPSFYEFSTLYLFLISTRDLVEMTFNHSRSQSCKSRECDHLYQWSASSQSRYSFGIACVIVR
jgi:hypothetical protein